jgi:hypothetical protein
MVEILGYKFIIALFWFILFWIFGGVFFAAVGIMRVIKLRKARFSCLFTILSAVCAYAAAHTGVWWARKEIKECIAQTHDVFGKMASVVACGIFEEALAAVIWFTVLILGGFILLYLTRAENQSWLDSDEGIEEDPSVFSTEKTWNSSEELH